MEEKYWSAPYQMSTGSHFFHCRSCTRQHQDHIQKGSAPQIIRVRRCQAPLPPLVVS